MLVRCFLITDWGYAFLAKILHSWWCVLLRVSHMEHRLSISSLLIMVIVTCQLFNMLPLYVIRIHKRKASLFLSLWFKKLRLGFLIFIWGYLKGEAVNDNHFSWVLCFLFLLKQCSLSRGVTKIRCNPTGHYVACFLSHVSLPLLSFSLLLDVSAFATKYRRKELENTLQAGTKGKGSWLHLFVWNL